MLVKARAATDGNPKTVANHQSAIKQKLGADTAIQLMRKAGELGLEPQG
jgi:DNA-binding NarL/FixJ family response regulator